MDFFCLFIMPKIDIFRQFMNSFFICSCGGFIELLLCCWNEEVSKKGIGEFSYPDKGVKQSKQKIFPKVFKIDYVGQKDC